MSQRSEFAGLNQATQCWDSGGVALIALDPFIYTFMRIYLDHEKAELFRAGYVARLGRPLTKHLIRKCEKAWSEYCRKHAQAMTMLRGEVRQNGTDHSVSDVVG